MKEKEIYNVLKHLPVSINNYYGDPVIQWEDTIDKISTLSMDHHCGPVGIITKGFIDKEKAIQLKEASKNLNLIVLVSISELPKDIEPVNQENRYKTLKNLADVGIPTIGYVRPLIPPFNTSKEILEKIISKISTTNCKTVVISGFRGDDNIIDKTNPDEKQKWVLRVKLMPKGTNELIPELEKKYNVQIFTRTSCGIAYELGLDKSYNPYYYSPRAARCYDCPIKGKCFNSNKKPTKESLEVIKYLGYDIEYIENPMQECNVDPANRLECISCCTSCFKLNNSHIEVKTDNIKLGDVAFIRFVTGGTLTSKENVIDGGNADVGHVKFPAMSMPNCEVHCINSWYVWAKEINHCFNCSYCITQVYSLENEKQYGCSPKELSRYIANATRKDEI